MDPARLRKLSCYITDYITKSQLKTHLAYAALELSVKKLGEYDPNEDEITMRAKRLLQRCAYTMLSHQELSAQQVSSYLMDYEDHFKSHSFQGLYWTSFESYIDSQDPSPECKPVKGVIPIVADQPVNEEPMEQHGNSGVNSEPGACPVDRGAVEVSIMSDESNGLPVDTEYSEDELLSDVDDSGSESDLSDADADDGVHAVQVDGGEDVVVDEEEVVVGINERGELVARSSRVSDYIMRGPALEGISLWEYTAQVRKERVSKLTRASSGYDDSDESGSEDEGTDSASSNLPLESIMDGDWSSVGAMLEDRRRKRPKFRFADGHTDCRYYYRHISHPHDRRVPVPLGPGIPRRDRKEVHARYCRLMLILFKPWVGPRDLRDNNQSWSDAFAAFFGNAQPSVLKVLDNMQILHECRDSRDNHYAARHARLSNASGYYGSGTDTRTDDDFGGDGDTELAILQHLQSLDNARSDRVAYTNKNVISCLAHAEKVGMFDCGTSVADTSAPTTSSDKIQVTESSEQLELLWEQEYECRRAAKKQASMHTSPTDNTDTNEPKSGKKSSINDGSAFREALDTPMTFLPSVRQDIAASDANVDVNVDQVIQEWTLNLEQSHAFRIIAEHSLEDKPKALRMFLGGQGGTGKSRVINALKSFFEKRNQKRRFRLASYTGVAARNISGMTLHAALLLNQRGRRGNRSKSNRDLVSMWQGVDYLLSMKCPWSVPSCWCKFRRRCAWRKKISLHSEESTSYLPVILRNFRPLEIVSCSVASIMCPVRNLLKRLCKGDCSGSR